ncbi:hypothetical protein GIB67_007210 [Kingdonia uniflora]|uniref:DUF8040 domain-containing protein n=1 Tax=Kingdonia uniflora TaxID=39325 RepID=A0A7J7NX10_9MAGN|nr:hypothetical protein GIB67_007210 [Kingdonia uniflora]
MHLFSLCGHFRARGWVIDSKHIDVGQKMAIFLETIAHSVRNRIMKQKHQHSGSTISRKGGLLHEELTESIFATRVATGRYATGPARDDFIDTATSDVAADLNMEDENVPTEQVDFIEDTIDTYFIDHHFKPFQTEHSFPQTEQYTPNHFGQSAPQPMQSASHSENSRRSGKNKRKVEDTLDKLDQLIEVIKTQGEQEELAK